LVVEQFFRIHVTIWEANIECDEGFFFLNFENNISPRQGQYGMYGLKLKSIWLSNQDQSVEKKH
jgi:hypothetical protein